MKIIAFIFLLVGTAAAQDLEPALAECLQLLRAKQYSAALKLCRDVADRAESLAQSAIEAKALAYSGACLRKLEQFPEMYQTYGRLLERSKHSEEVERALTSAGLAKIRKRQAEIRQKHLSDLKVACPPQLKVILDAGKPRSCPALFQAIRAGEHRLTLKDGAETREVLNVQLTAGLPSTATLQGKREVPDKLAPQDKPKVPEKAKPLPDGPVREALVTPARPVRWKAPVGWTALGLGVALGGTGLFFASEEQAARDAFESEAGSASPSTEKLQGHLDDISNNADTKELLLIGAVGLATIGGGLLAWHYLAEDSEPSVSLGPRGVAVLFEF
jgi:hypothetical protein